MHNLKLMNFEINEIKKLLMYAYKIIRPEFLSHLSTYLNPSLVSRTVAIISWSSLGVILTLCGKALLSRFSSRALYLIGIFLSNWTFSCDDSGGNNLFIKKRQTGDLKQEYYYIHTTNKKIEAAT